MKGHFTDYSGKKCEVELNEDQVQDLVNLALEIAYTRDGDYRVYTDDLSEKYQQFLNINAKTAE